VELTNDITAKDVGMIFKRDGEDLPVLDSINLEVARGSLVAIVGPSGCGKSTLLKILAKLLAPTKGEAWIDLKQIEDGIAYVPQSPLLLPWRTLLQNAALGIELKGQLSSGALQSIKYRIESYGLSGFEQSLTTELSGGMAQRVALIRALESNPKVLFCDEPFSAIDFVTRLSLTTQFKKMCGVQNITTVLVTHNIEEAIFLGDKVIVMSGRPGRIIATHQPYLSVGAYDAVECRRAPEFNKLFVQIWEEMKDGIT